ncbi:hypothetical protein [Flavobacterium cellulosilyticum]|uniref:Uncharacterized protein n=1 Tax=Flavobacterium cellulosilyticum TaxID=2541731 RepID=A0A4R5C1Y1_9FLAO|nr:hypothetical protein [Flavobacterium cellulosilyticum]TDD93608.1 hypothetical protein E0F76_18855 [Flavobacterium cellulosilyticum]
MDLDENQVCPFLSQKNHFFNRFHLYIALRVFGKENKNALENAQANIKKYNYKDPNQVIVINAALNELKIK